LIREFGTNGMTGPICPAVFLCHAEDTPGFVS
jgi:hypothetical protein